jgi:serine/threonine protein kinase
VDEVEFGRYRLQSVIGKGGMGTVYRAHDTVIGRDVAVKVLPIELGEEPGYRERFRREAHTAARLSEPHIISIFDTGEIDGQLYLVMPIVNGVDVHELLQRDGPMTPLRAVHVIEQLAAALQAAHAAGLVHRDIKPSNALVTGNDFVYLIDFGIAHDGSATKLTNTGMLVGTLAYMAPERFTAGRADARSDVYALACVLHECLTGDQPFPGDSMEQQIAGHLTLEPPRPSERRTGVPVGFDDVIATGMAKDPAQRYQSAHELASAARQALTATQYRGRDAPAGPPAPARPAPVGNRPAYPTFAGPQQHSRSWPGGSPPPSVDRPRPQLAEPGQRPSPRLAWLLVAVIVVLVGGAAGITGYLLSKPGAKSQAPAVVGHSSSEPSAISTSSTEARPAPTSAATTPAGVSGIGPFVGRWQAHKESLVIEATGHGHQTFTGGSVDFTLTSVSGDTATGTVTASSAPDSTVAGDPVTVTLVGNGQGLKLSRGKEQQFPYCNSNSPGNYYCGA